MSRGKKKVSTCRMASLYLKIIISLKAFLQFSHYLINQSIKNSLESYNSFLFFSTVTFFFPSKLSHYSHFCTVGLDLPNSNPDVWYLFNAGSQHSICFTFWICSIESMDTWISYIFIDLLSFLYGMRKSFISCFLKWDIK